MKNLPVDNGKFKGNFNRFLKFYYGGSLLQL